MFKNFKDLNFLDGNKDLDLVNLCITSAFSKLSKIIFYKYINISYFIQNK